MPVAEIEKTRNEVLNELAERWFDAKKAETIAKNRRYDIEREITEMSEYKCEGSITQRTDDYKIVITYNLNRKVDPETCDQVVSEIPAELRPITYEPKLNVTELKILQKKHPMYYKIFSRCLTEKPGKPSIKIETI